MFWTDGSIQTSFSTTEILIALSLLILGSIYYLWRTRRIRQAAGGNGVAFRKSFIKLAIIPLILAVIILFSTFIFKS